jgi:hypothetical protein
VWIAIPVFGQQPQQPKSMVEEAMRSNVTYEFHNVDANRAIEIVSFVRALTGNVSPIEFFPAFRTAICHMNRNLDDAKMTCELLRKYDVPPPPRTEVELTAYLVLASPPGTAQPAGSRAVPPELQSAITQMKQSLADRTYSLRDAVAMRMAVRSAQDSTGGPASSSESGLLSGLGSYTYGLRYHDVRFSLENKSTSIESLEFSIRACPAETCANSTMSTPVTIREGQKLVLGKLPLVVSTAMKLAPAGNGMGVQQISGDLYVVITSKALEPEK